jgi:hypothetical protein
VSASDEDKVNLSKFDESDPDQFRKKIMVGCGIYFGFRGAKEHVFLRKSDWITGVFGPSEPYAGKRFVGLGVLVTDKKKKVTTFDSYLRDTTDIMKIPVLDDTDPNDFGGSVLRYLGLLEDDQVRNYCYEKKTIDNSLDSRYPYMKRKHIGKDPIARMMKEAAVLMGLDMSCFRGGHAFRRYYISGMVNDPTVPIQESMKAARHTSVSAHLAYMQSNKATATARISHLIKRNAAPSTNVTSPNYEKKDPAKLKVVDNKGVNKKIQNSCVRTACVESPLACSAEEVQIQDGSNGGKLGPPSTVTASSSVVSSLSPSNTQEEIEAFKKECAIAEERHAKKTVAASSSVVSSISPSNTQEEMQAFKNECAIAEERRAALIDLTNTCGENQNTARSRARNTHALQSAKDRFLNLNGWPVRNRASTGMYCDRPCTDTTDSISRRTSAGPGTFSRYHDRGGPTGLTPEPQKNSFMSTSSMNRPQPVYNPYTKQLYYPRPEMSNEQREIRRLRFKVMEMNKLAAKREQEVQNYEEKLHESSLREEDMSARLKDFEAGVEFDHLMGSWNYADQQRNYGNGTGGNGKHRW